MPDDPDNARASSGHSDWTFPVCEQPNAFDADHCIACKCPFDAGAEEVKNRKKDQLARQQERCNLDPMPTTAERIGIPGWDGDEWAVWQQPYWRRLGILTSIALRALWYLGILLVAVVVGFYLGLSFVEARGVIQTAGVMLMWGLYALVFVPAAIVGLMPLLAIARTPLIVRIFVWCSVPVFLIVALWR